jgi:precorrin-2/cobalt-factor-2 C20-methyltransferase
MAGMFIGVGVGPGDPELMTLKAARLIREADVVAYLCNESGESQSRSIASDLLAQPHAGRAEFAITMPMCNDRTLADTIYDQAAADIAASLLDDKSVVFLCEGDPLFFASFGYLLERIQFTHECQVVPGISSVHAASSVLLQPLAMLKESFCVMSGRHSLEKLIASLNVHDSVVIIKAGRSRNKIMQALRQSDRLNEASYLEYIGRDQEYVMRDVEQLNEESGPYFSLFVIVRHNRDRS